MYAVDKLHRHKDYYKYKYIKYIVFDWFRTVYYIYFWSKRLIILYILSLFPFGNIYNCFFSRNSRLIRFSEYIIHYTFTLKIRIVFKWIITFHFKSFLVVYIIISHTFYSNIIFDNKLSTAIIQLVTHIAALKTAR